MYVLGLSVGAGSLRMLAARAPTGVSEAIEHLRAYGHHYDVIVIGSSLVRVNFVPKVFDKTMKENGYPVRSFSFAMSGLNGSELDYYLECVLRLKLQRLKWILIDVTLSQNPRLKEKNYYKRRVIRWHDPERYLQVQRSLIAGTKKPRLLVERSWIHFQHLLLNLGNVGEGQQVLRTSAWLGLRPKPKKAYRFNLRMKDSKKRRSKAEAYRRRNGARHWEARQQLIRDRRLGNNANRYLPLACRWQQMVASRGYSPFFIIGPSLHNATFRTDDTGNEPLRMLDLDDPAAYPELYDVRNRYDINHMTYAGSVSYTRALANLLANLIRQGNRRSRLTDFRSAEEGNR